MIKRKVSRFIRIFFYISIVLMLVSCSTTTYELDSYRESQVGRGTRDAKALGTVERVALVAFTAQAPSIADVKVIGPLVDLAFEQALDEMEAQSSLTFIPMEEVINNETYASMRVDLDPQTYSPLEGLTDLPGSYDSLDIAGLCDALHVDALLLFQLQFDFGFPTLNAVTMKDKSKETLIGPPEGKVIWGGLTQTAWEETIIPVPASFSLLLGVPNMDEWKVIIESASQVPKVRGLGGAPIYFLAQDASAAR